MAFRRVVGRRGLLAGVAALVGGALARATQPTAQAADGDKVKLGFDNNASSRTVLQANLGGLSGAALEVRNKFLDVLSKEVTYAVIAKDIAPPPGNELNFGSALRGEGGNGAGSGIGGLGIVPSGGNSEAEAAGTAVVAVGGDSDQANGRVAAELTGGGSDTKAGGLGLRTLGGSAIHKPGGSSGPGIIAFGGDSATHIGGRGLVASGGDATAPGAAPGVGVAAYGGVGRRGKATPAAGVVGIGGGADGFGETGVFGEGSPTNQGLGTMPGLWGNNNGAGPGLAGQCKSEAGQPDEAIAAVHGLSVDGTGGLCESTNGPGLVALGPAVGVLGLSTSESGLVGISEGEYGIVGTSTTGPGCDGRSTNNVGGGFGTENAGVPGLVAFNSQAGGGPAGNGSGGMFLNGGWVVVNGLKSAAVPTSRGTRLLYCLEATVALFEDFGVARLVNGRARVELDSLFAETVETGSYHIFLTPRGDNKGLYIAVRDARGFEIREGGGGTASIEVNYRVVAPRKGLQPNHRLARFRPPEPPKPVELKRPKPLTLPKPKLPEKPREREQRERRR